MSDFGTMRTVIADELVRDDLSTYIARAITTACALWEGKRFYFNEKRFRLATVASQEYYALSSMTNTDGTALSTGERLLEIDSFTLTYNDQPYRLCEQTQQWFDDNQANATTYTGQPAAYGIFGDQIRFHPIPDAVYQTTISGLARLATLTNDTDTNAWMTDAEALIRNQAKLIIYRDIVRDADGVAIAKDAIAEALDPLQRKTSAKVMTGRIAPWTL